MSNLPPGFRESDVCGPKCPECGVIDGCECEVFDQRTPAERRAQEMADAEED